MKKPIAFSVDYPITILMLVLAVLLLGFISFRRLGMDLFPDLNSPRIFIDLSAGERPPEEIEKQYVMNIESQAIRQKGAVQVSSVSRVGSAQVTVEYAWETNMNDAYLDLQKSLNDFKQNADIDELTISQIDPNAEPIILLGFSHPTPLYSPLSGGMSRGQEGPDMDELRRIAETYIRNELIRLEGIADVRLLGQEEKEVIIETDDYLLQAYNVTPSTIASRIQEYNRNVAGGSLTEMGTKYIIKGVSEFNSIDDIGQVIVAMQSPTTSGSTGGVNATVGAQYIVPVPVFLNDVAKVRFTNKEPDNIVHINGKRCMALAVYKETHYNTVRAVSEFMKSLETIRKALPGYELTVVQNNGEFIANSISEVKQSALFGILLAVAVLYIFLRRIGVTFIISLAIPVSIVATFNLMYFNHLTLNIMTLGGLALGAGMLVDNAIVVMENIFRNLESGLSLRDAAILGTSQVSGAITSSTLTTIVVFLPIVYLHGSAGELFKDQAWTVAFSLLSSLAVALFVIPMLSARFLKSAAKELQVIPRLNRGTRSIRFPRYAEFLRRTLDHKWPVIGATVILMVVSAMMIPFVGSEFMPKTDINEFSVDLTLPKGTELNRTESTVADIETSIRDVLGDDIKTTYSVVGPSRKIMGTSNVVYEDENTATIEVILKKDRSTPSDVVLARIGTVLQDIPDLQAQIIQEQSALDISLGSEVAPVIIEIQGEDLDEIQKLVEEVRTRVSALDELTNIETSFDEGRPEIDIVIDRVRAGMYNVGIEAVNSQLQNLLLGTSAGEWETGGELKDITIRQPRLNISQLENVTIKSGTSDVRLYEIADITVSQSPEEISRRNQVRIGSVTAHIGKNVPLDQVVGRIEAALSGIAFPQNYRYTVTGEEQKRRDAFRNLKFALILSMILVYMVLASQFESLVHPFTIILSIPLAGVGVVAIFLLLGKSFDIMAYIGIIMLAGIAVNDSIILVDAITQLKREGLALRDAIIEAGQRRIRPILMTSLTTILALLPLTVGIGEGAALRSPMALAVIGGLITSTILTLVVIPCVYEVMDKLFY